MNYLFIDLPTSAQRAAIELLKSDVEFEYDNEYNQATDQEIIRHIILKQYLFTTDGENA